MELRHIRYFLAVAEEGNFTRAAARLGIGQPPLSQQIRDLEIEIGTRLFHRIPRGAELTEAGNAFLAAVRTLPEQVQGAVRSAQRAGRGETGALRVGFTSAAAMNPLVPATIRAFRHQYPQVQVSLSESNSTSLADNLRSGSIDVAFIRPGGSGLADILVVSLPDEPLILALPKDHFASGNDPDVPVPLASLQHDPFILTPREVGPSLFDSAIAACMAVGFYPHLGQAAPQIASVLSLVAAAEGVSIVPRSMRQLALEGVSYREIKDIQPSTRLSLAYSRGSQSIMIRNFVSIARQTIGCA